MTRHRILIALAAALLILTLAACGDDDGQTRPEIGDGPAEDISGLWTGDYASAEDLTKTGTFCWNIDQDGRAVDGVIAFGNGAATELAGLVIGSSLQLVWGSIGAEPSGSASTELTFATGGTLTGSASGGEANGQYTALDGDRGDWRANRVDSGDCG